MTEADLNPIMESQSKAAEIAQQTRTEGLVPTPIYDDGGDIWIDEVNRSTSPPSEYHGRLSAAPEWARRKRGYQ